jgi:chromosome segregation ATPase
MTAIDDAQTAAIQQLQAQFAAAAARLDAMATQIQTGGDRITATEQRYAAGEARLTGIEAGLRSAVDDFTPVAGRVSELSAAALAFNGRLNAVEEALAALSAAAPPAPEARLLEVEAALDALSGRLANVEQTRARGGHLSQRLQDIEARLSKVDPEPTTEEGGGTTE